MSELKAMNLRWLAVVTLAMCAGLCVFLVVSCSTVDRAAVAPLQIEGATFVGDKACLDCHANISRAFPASPHARLHLAGGLGAPASLPADSSGEAAGRDAGVPRDRAGQTGCESCHGPASKHIAMAGRGGLEKFIINPGKNPGACFECHQEVKAEFHFPAHHPVLEGKMNCVQCHDPHGQDIMKPKGGLAMARLNESCAQCHREQAKPVVFEHAAMREGCTACHTPHGSVNEKMLTVRDSNLCLRCHAQTQTAGGIVFIGNKNHTPFLRMGTCWTAGCHSAVHGSNVQPYYLY